VHLRQNNILQIVVHLQRQDVDLYVRILIDGTLFNGLTFK
jgi:hypothetical protein